MSAKQGFKTFKISNSHWKMQISGKYRLIRFFLGLAELSEQN